MLSSRMRQAIAYRILGVAARLAGTRISFDEFIHDVTDAHIGLLQTDKDLESVKDLLLRSQHVEPAQRLEKVQADLKRALEVFRTLDAMYSTGKLRYGPRAPQVRQKPTTHGMESSQKRPSVSRPRGKVLR